MYTTHRDNNAKTLTKLSEPFFLGGGCYEVPESELLLHYFFNGPKGMAALPKSCVVTHLGFSNAEQCLTVVLICDCDNHCIKLPRINKNKYCKPVLKYYSPYLLTKSSKIYLNYLTDEKMQVNL